MRVMTNSKRPLLAGSTGVRSLCLLHTDGTCFRVTRSTPPLLPVRQQAAWRWRLAALRFGWPYRTVKSMQVTRSCSPPYNS